MFDLLISNAVFQVRLGQDEDNGLERFGLLDFLPPFSDTLEGVMAVGGDTNHENVSVLELILTVDTLIIVTGGIVDFGLDLVLLNFSVQPYDIENGRLVVLAVVVVEVPRDKARLTN